MDAISYSYADKAQKRIKKFIENPDSTSGVVTVPSVIASGETITIPAGRTAVLPNVQIDGTLNVEGTVFIPTGTKTSKVIPRVTSTDNAIVRFDGTNGDVQNSSILIDDNGNLNITGTGKRITGDFSNATHNSRVAFQTSTLNSVTVVGVLPNGTATSSFLPVYNNSDNSNASFIQLSARATVVSIDSAAFGTGTILPLAFTTGGAERMRIDTSGNVLVTGSGALGYGTGSGGTVTQATSKGTTVTLNKPTGTITMNNEALAADAVAAFTFYNSSISIYDLVYIISNDPWKYDITTASGSGGCTIVIKNKTAGSLSEAIVLTFIVLKGAIA